MEVGGRLSSHSHEALSTWRGQWLRSLVVVVEPEAGSSNPDGASLRERLDWIIQRGPSKVLFLVFSKAFMDRI